MNRRYLRGVLVLAAGLLLVACRYPAQDLSANASEGDDSVTPGGYSSDYVGTLLYVAAGRFRRDADPGNISEVSAFRMSRYEITREQFETIMGTDPSDTSVSNSTSDPVQGANSYHAIAFCNKPSLAEDLKPVYSVDGITDWADLDYADIPTDSDEDWKAATADWSANGYRLPTEMEWMWAAMGAPADGQNGGANTTGYLKAFAGSTGSNAIDDYAVYWSNSGPEDGNAEPRTTRPVGSKLPNELGLYDMSANASEWVWDRWATEYPSGTLTDYRGPTSGAARVRRGGNWRSGAAPCSIADRWWIYPHSGSYLLGFQVVRP